MSRLPVVKRPRVRDERLDDEPTAGSQLGGDPFKARDLRSGVGHREDRVVRQHGERERPTGGRDRGEVADRHRDVSARGLAAQARHHLGRTIDSGDGQAAGGQRQRQAPPADPQLAHRSALRQVRQALHRRLGLRQAPVQLVVGVRDGLAVRIRSMV